MINNKKLRVFEAFAGIGAQAAALKRANINYEVVGISEWFVDALECYAAIHRSDANLQVDKTKDEILKELSKYTFSRDSVHPCDISKLGEDALYDLYRANSLCKNYGSISDIKAQELPDIDLLVYSFPCQDLSTGGLGKGMSKGSGTRSGLLWEIEKILNGLKEENRLPQYLLLENVKTIRAASNKKDLDAWLSFLESLGYYNDDCLLLNALDFGVPQDRERAFIISHLGSKLNVVVEKRERTFEFNKFFRDNYLDPILKAEADAAQLNKTPSREKMWDINGRALNDKTIVRTITCNMDRTHCAALFPYIGAKGKSYRRPTIREAFLLMGFSEDDYLKTLRLEYSYRKMNKLIGNSIVVNVLEELFRKMFLPEYGKV